MATVSSNSWERGKFPRSRPLLSRFRRGQWIGLLFIAPWLLSFLAFDAIPILSSFYYSFTDWSITGRTTTFIGFANYTEALKNDPLFWKSVSNTAFYIVFSVPLGTITAFSIALLLNVQVKGKSLYRSFFYLPSLIPAVAASMVWTFIFETRRGILNYGLELLGLPIVQWLGNPNAAKPALIIMTMWTVGVPMVIYLAGLQSIPHEYYEVAEIDGANVWQRLFKITIPLMTPTIFFNFMMSMITAFQVFNNAFIMTGGGPNNATLFYMLHIYNNAFRYFRMGYASALAVFTIPACAWFDDSNI